MVKEAEEFADQDKAVKSKIDARNQLETFLYNAKSTVEDKAKDKVRAGWGLEGGSEARGLGCVAAGGRFGGLLVLHTSQGTTTDDGSTNTYSSQRKPQPQPAQP